MIHPPELQTDLPIDLSGSLSTTSQVWKMLHASFTGDLEHIKTRGAENKDLLYCKYNYTPPIHFAVREGHVALVQYLLEHGAYEPDYQTYPFLDKLVTIAEDRRHHEIAELLKAYAPEQFAFRKDWNGVIHFPRTDAQREFESVVDMEDLDHVKQMLLTDPELVNDPTYFWGEGLMMMPAKDGNIPLLELLMNHGAKVPDMSKWAQFYYFKHLPVATFLMENGMNPNHMSWHHVSLLHDMAQKGDLAKAALLIKYGAETDVIEEEYQSTPLGLAARWGHPEMVSFLLQQGADPNLSGAAWATPLAWAKDPQIESMLRKAGAK